MQLNIQAPTLSFKVTSELIEEATPDNTAHCIIAKALRANLPLRIRSIIVHPNFIRFNMPMVVDGEEKLVRLRYETPAKVELEAKLFDENSHQHGIDFAKANAKRNYTFILQTRAGSVHDVERARQRADRYDSNRKLQRVLTKNERVVRCVRRYHPKESFKVVDAATVGE